MTSFHSICGLGLSQQILGTPTNWRSPEKNFWRLFFWRTLAPVSLVLGLGLEHSCPWPREVLSSEGLSLALASDFFVSLALALASSLVSSTPPLTNTINTVFFIRTVLYGHVTHFRSKFNHKLKNKPSFRMKKIYKNTGYSTPSEYSA